MSRTGPSFAVFRGTDAPGGDIPFMTAQPLSPETMTAAGRMVEAGVGDGSETKVLFASETFSLVRAWFKSGYPLPRHSHSSDCLYYIIAGSLRIGTETLGTDDGFFVGAGTPYAYTPGEDGVEILEFRAHGAFDIRVLANNPAFWAKALATVASRRQDWLEETAPSSRTP